MTHYFAAPSAPRRESISRMWKFSSPGLRSVVLLCGLAGGLLYGQENNGGTGARLSIKDKVAVALESGQSDAEKVAGIKTVATELLRDKTDDEMMALPGTVREMADEAVAVRAFQAMLADAATAIPAACALPEDRDPFYKAVEAGRANAIRDWIGASLHKAGAPTVRQVAALTQPPEWLREGFIKWLTHDKMLGADHPRQGGQLAARLLLLLDERERPGSRTIQAGFVEWQMEDPAARGEVGAMAAYLAGVTEACPAFATASGWDSAVVRPMSVAWRKRLLAVAGKAKGGAGADWRKTIDECFLTPLKGMAKDERTLAATGLDGCLEFLLEPAKTTGWAELSTVRLTNVPATRAERSKALMDLFQPYPEFQLPIVRKEASELPPFVAGRPDEPPAQMVAALEDSTTSLEQRFAIVGELSRTPKPRYQEVAAAGFVLAMRDVLRAGSVQAVANAASRLPTGSSINKHPAWIKAAADTAAMTAAAYKAQAKSHAWRDSSPMKHIVEAAISGQAKELAAELIHTYGAGLHGDTNLITALAEADWLDLAGKLCNELPQILPFDNYPRLAKPPEWLPRLLEMTGSKSDRYRIGLAVSSLSCDGMAPRMEETVMARIMPMAEQYGETADLPAASRMQCLALLCREPTVAYRLKEELERVAAEIRPDSLRSRGTILGGLDTREAWYLEAAFLGNLMRDGRCREVERRLDPILADPSDYEAGEVFLDLCTRMFYEHVLWLLADGQAGRGAEAIPLSLRLYAAQDWTYGEQATMFVELCHAAGKRYGEFENRLAGQGDDTRKAYRNRRFGPPQLPLPFNAAFYQLGVCPRLRSGWDGEACEDLRIAGILTLAGDPALVKAQSRGRPLAEIVSLNIKRWATDTPADRLAVIARWRERHPNHPLLDETERLLREEQARSLSQ